MPIHLEAPSHNAAGPDGQGWNRLRVDAILMDQCAMMPKDYPSLKYESSNTILAKWGNFGRCFNAGKCRDCEMMKPTTLTVFGDRMLVRIDEKNQPWIMNRFDKGWSEYGQPRPWSFFARLEGWIIGDRFRDNDSEGFWLIRANDQADR